MIEKSGIIYYYPWHTPQPAKSNLGQSGNNTQIDTIIIPHTRHTSERTASHTHSSWSHILGMTLLIISLGGIASPFIHRWTLDTNYALNQSISTMRKNLASKGDALRGYIFGTTKLVAETPVDTAANRLLAEKIFNPMLSPDGSTIVPVNTDFGLVIPKIGVNAPVIPAVNPTKPSEYDEALKKGIAHSSLSYFPDQDGTVYLFSHSTNYDWFVKDLNAVFYLLKNLDTDDPIFIVYKGKTYAYKTTDKRVVSPQSVAYLVPQPGTKRLILETCWPPGSTTQRLLIFADLIEQTGQQI
jgi:LPXTG-site transpeptidase (sortase) family protein